MASNRELDLYTFALNADDTILAEQVKHDMADLIAGKLTLTEAYTLVADLQVLTNAVEKGWEATADELGLDKP